MSKTERVTTIAIVSRDRLGTTGAKATRRAGQTPAVLYGHGAAPQAVAVDTRALSDLLAKGGLNRVLDAELDGVHDSVLLRSVERHPITHRPLSADFQRVAKGEAFTAAVSIVTVGVARGVRDAGAMLDLVLHTLEIRGPADRMPEQLEIDVTALGVGEHVVAGAVALPAGFSLITPADATVVAIEGPRNAVEPSTAVPAAEPVATPT